MKVPEATPSQPHPVAPLPSPSTRTLSKVTLRWDGEEPPPRGGGGDEVMALRNMTGCEGVRRGGFERGSGDEREK